ncbi:FtsW/RodA/SpoVE family cell cycle protein [Lutibacter flavus]|uniref:Probable peptidoglycan glycosyltransferase FtsW n=1 Tax=Lutibacter flavus TaxID=691689 RepID=A0A238Z8G5_9FLAO|nr:FtsW/RodA/SpoVE family cell cycle protein [Lutibacter flavus]SNR79412.1 cell division protein FtsW [Lutibacter flavus]
MKNILRNIEGDRAIWAVVGIMALLSFMPVYSASTNLVYVANSGTTTYHLIKHIVLLFFGFLIIYGVHKIPYRYFSGGSVLMLPLVIVLLIVTLTKGTVIGGANASRWITIPFIGVGFQTSTLAGLVLMVYVARYLAKNKDKIITFKESLWQLWLPVAATLIFILPANFSTTAIIFSMVLLLTFIGGYPFKYLASIVGMGVLALTLFVLTSKAFPNVMPNRVDTWISRIENFSDKNAEEGYQVEKAKIAIASGGLQGRGPGKSVQKNFLPQSSSDFIFAIIVEEYGLIFGALTVILMYLLLLFRILVAAKKATTIFATLLIIGVGLPIIFQAIINMAVAVNLFPVTGQTLPLISSGGTSIWMTCFAIGIILSVTADKEKIMNPDNEENPLDILHEAID